MGSGIRSAGLSASVRVESKRRWWHYNFSIHHVFSSTLRRLVRQHTHFIEQNDAKMLTRIALATTLYVGTVFSLPSHSSDLETPLDSGDHVLQTEPELAVFCIAQDHTATTEDFASGAPPQGSS
ncbi:hypothetical protein CLAFUW4_10271 [Fulvia fulva]|uniref:Uncharacterized protein n=1 Tax=Passalora fulva TaxID=5499 RepID=A0A9Q8LH74_PASFU|nr:uncharacterized protein CLAFUR5_04884 [Fulvia fulva]KAK4615363.1 hypothetical protein CLAFUR4_10275 [Fulvia fulva]KAK4616453.1 hypothetical protein CLAFUR0_10273 [Fulvia fulva]UJO17109.1 hypothetical protein CLAFUR5_04884 [Fulvia fulva]WPV19351.1 hypothetical protein CLAFUW4_10271 [Fulvia fulva]WPV34638.1 hypothetical protein CLAFUW7_10271 [Fulvia fulva]